MEQWVICGNSSTHPKRQSSRKFSYSSNNIHELKMGKSSPITDITLALMDPHEVVGITTIAVRL